MEHFAQHLQSVIPQHARPAYKTISKVEVTGTIE
jgi:hypothetical protein